MRGFSLIELLVVMVIISILAAIGITQYNKYRANAMYNLLETNLKTAVSWAEGVSVEFGVFPSGTCDASSLSGSGVYHCTYQSVNSTINVVTAPAGVKDLAVNIPLIVSFTPSSTGSNCGVVKVECPIDRCAGLTNNAGTGKAVVCMDTCANPMSTRADTNLHGVVGGGCP